MLSPYHKDGCTRFFREFLEAYRPDVVHFQHTLFIGFDVLTVTRHTLPQTPIVYTLHEYVPICHRDGQMIRTRTDELCLEASPRRCHGCFPEIPQQSFFLRKRFIAAHFSHVDAFLAPSRFLQERYVEWGVPRAKIHFEDYGRLPVQRLDDGSEDRPRNRLAFFGQFNQSKGIHVLLEAMRMLSGAGGEPPPHGIHLWVHGANLEFQTEEYQRRFRKLLDDTRSTVTLVGRYDQTRLPQLMANVDWVVVPSIWWENSPLVIQEAFAHGRPVICSDIGAMAEKVQHGVNGLHFRANDPVGLANTLKAATETPELWQRLRKGISPVYPMTEHVGKMERLYERLLAQRAA